MEPVQGPHGGNVPHRQYQQAARNTNEFQPRMQRVHDRLPPARARKTPEFRRTTCASVVQKYSKQRRRQGSEIAAHFARPQNNSRRSSTASRSGSCSCLTRHYARSRHQSPPIKCNKCCIGPLFSSGLATANYRSFLKLARNSLQPDSVWWLPSRGLWRQRRFRGQENRSQHKVSVSLTGQTLCLTLFCAFEHADAPFCHAQL